VVRPEVLHRRLKKLDEYFSILEKLKRYSQQEFTTEPERYGSAERFLQLAIEAINDMASHVVAENELGIVSVSSDLPRLFEASGFTNEKLTQKWIQMIGFRNILVHDYLEVDRSIVYQVLQHNLPDLKALQRMFAQFL
jgi:uncharacterized protein YutE (UPF0331/DUF86 family)